MSIVLYHGGAAANSLKALLPLFEKKVDFKSHLMALINFEQHEPWFVKINPRGQVPVLVHDDRVLDESTLINEYVDDTFPGLPLKPSDAFGRHQMRLWTKFVDEYFCPALSFLGWHAMIKNAVAHLSKEEFEAKVARIPLKEQQDKWRESASQVWTPEQLADWRRKVKTSIERIENGMLGDLDDGRAVHAGGRLLLLDAHQHAGALRRHRQREGQPESDRLVCAHARARLGEAGARHRSSRLEVRPGEGRLGEVPVELRQRVASNPGTSAASPPGTDS